MAAGSKTRWNWAGCNKHSTSQQLVNREHDTVSWMIGNLRRSDVLTHEASTELFKRYIAGAITPTVSDDDDRRRVPSTADSKRAHDALVTANMKLVVAIAKRYRHSGIEFEDLLQEGNLGLIKAIERFDWERGYRFSTYATWWIRQAVSQYVMKHSNTVRLPAHAIGVGRKMEDARAAFKKEFGHDPSVEELSALMDVSESIVKATVNGRKKALSLSTPLDRDGEGGDTLGDVLVDHGPMADPFEVLAEKETREIMRKGFSRLTPREDKVVRLRFGIGAVDGEGDFSMSSEDIEEVRKRAEAEHSEN